MTDNIECTHCNGYGSSLKDTGDGRCSQCGGSGLRKDQKQPTNLDRPLPSLVYNLVVGFGESNE